MPAAKLWIIPGSHPCLAVAKALEMKGIEFTTVDLLPVMHKPVMKVRFGQATVPGLELDGERIVGSRRIMARLDSLVPEPRLYPEDPEARAAVEAAEAWGDEVLQAASRRMIWGLFSHAKGAVASYAEDSPLPDAVAAAMTPAVIATERRISAEVGASLIEAFRDLERLAGHFHLPVQSGSDRVLARIALTSGK